MQNILFAAAFLSEDIHPFILPGALLLFVIWLVHRIEGRSAENAIYKNFPFFKEAVNSFQQKLDYLNLTVQSLESRIVRLEKDRADKAP
ncbi:MAG: hypothetical protein PHE18_06075 [Candidatus Omnitrophica bacterium]|nr:hypothetical protein [Candidatus Omnitrophota bacterium]MDD5553426.1 hypothetical protein [Candidatus Omnitrophota bacterium]